MRKPRRAVAWLVAIGLVLAAACGDPDASTGAGAARQRDAAVSTSGDGNGSGRAGDGKGSSGKAARGGDDEPTGDRTSGHSGRATTSSGGRQSDPPATTAKVQLGAYVNETVGRGAEDAHVRASPEHDQIRRRDIEELEAKLGRTLAIDHHFRAFDEEIITHLELWDREKGRLPMVSWHAIDTDAVTRGDHDAWIDAQAKAVAAFGSRILIRWGWEMEAARNQLGSGNRTAFTASPASFVSAWNHLRARFATAGAKNAAWVWCPMATSFSSTDVLAYYPGAKAVEWVCADGYNFGSAERPTAWRSMPRIFADFYEWAKTQGRPIMIGEVGVQERQPGEKAAWFDQVRDTLADFDGLDAFVYFDSHARYDWRVTTSQSAFEAFRRLARDPVFWAKG